MKNQGNNAVLKWLQDLRLMSENECLCVLQAKSLASKVVRRLQHLFSFKLSIFFSLTKKSFQNNLPKKKQSQH